MGIAEKQKYTHDYSKIKQNTLVLLQNIPVFNISFKI